jgi:D-alanyl-D-alanine carboxypeptidase
MATLVLQLVAEGKLKLSDTVERHLPGVVPNGGRITVRMLLNHTSGLYNYTEDTVLIQRLFAHPEQSWTSEEIAAAATKHKPNFAPGTSWSYSNTNYTLVGMILKKVTGQPPAELVERRSRPTARPQAHLSPRIQSQEHWAGMRTAT